MEFARRDYQRKKAKFKHVPPICSHWTSKNRNAWLPDKNYRLWHVARKNKQDKLEYEANVCQAHASSYAPAYAKAFSTSHASSYSASAAKSAPTSSARP
jgi:hypothetical protein